MKINFLKFNRSVLLSIQSLRKPIFNIYFYWGMAIIISFGLFLLAIFLGAKIFSYEYNQSYKKENSKNNDKIINTERIKNFIEKRQELIYQKIPVLKNPSI